MTTPPQNMARPKVGLAIFLVHNNKVLFVYRIKKLGQGTWAPPGGHLEGGESWEECAIRESEEEVGLAPHSLKFCGVTNDIFDGNHYITLYMEGLVDTPDYQIKEPEKYVKHQWVDWNNLPSPLFPCMQNYLDAGLRPSYITIKE